MRTFSTETHLSHHDRPRFARGVFPAEQGSVRIRELRQRRLAGVEEFASSALSRTARLRLGAVPMISNLFNLAKQADVNAIQGAVVAFASGQGSDCRRGCPGTHVRVTGGRTSHVGAGSHRTSRSMRLSAAMRRDAWTYQAYFAPAWSASPASPPKAGKKSKDGSKELARLREALALEALPTRRSAPQSRLAA